MKIPKDTIIEVNHSRNGKFTAIAIRDFDTDIDEFYPVALYQAKPVNGMNNSWIIGEEIPCRNTLCKITVSQPNP